MQILYLYIGIIFLTCILVVILKPTVKGWLGEKSTAFLLSRLKPVVYSVNLNKEIQKYKDKKFTFDEVEVLVNKIDKLNVDSKEHVHNIKNERN